MKNKFLAVILLIFISFIIIGCSKDDNVKNKETENNKEKYLKYVQKLKNIDESTKDMPFNVNVEYNKVNENEVRFEVSIDNPKGTVKNIKALAIHNYQTDDIFPSVGIFDDSVTLVEGEKPEGIVLAGYIPYTDDIDDLNVEVKVIIKYEYDGKKSVGYYVTKKVPKSN